MREGWKEITIGDLGQVITGNTPPRKQPDLYGKHTIFVKPTDMEVDKKYCYNPEEYYSEKGFIKYKKSLIPKGSTCVVTIGSIGQKMIKAHTELFINQAVNAIVPNNYYDEDFVYYLLKINLFQLKTFDSGTASGRENVSKSSFSNIKLIVPKSKRTQSKIASILSSYDDLIENNLKRIKLLEEKAQITYEEWFVKMRFPGYKTAKFDEVTGFPEGWERKNIGLFTDILKGKNITKSTICDGKIPVVAGGLNPAYYHDTANTFNPVITVSASGANAGFVNLYLEDVWASDCSYVDSKMSKHVFFIYSTLKQNQDIITNLQQGAAQPHVYPKDLKKIEILIPELKYLNQFESIALSIFDSIRNFKMQNKLLKEARGILLPRLMSGMIDVEQLQIETLNV
ncbi:restriction endonuclease subunit S [Flavobacterium sp. LC2016-12]|uniref:restriction endonuclease subunit S n=1 Tax=Flavobacterium sp. LC2016-12 TaxID=2783794 RepID=UPI00188C420A|nr:restriction endonuclease subunit S [Flavobacterium sp. LC2016-12]MBF4464211.1 restriction endonuclease subunit S [Flavobacterium sp. LC2016-12]